MSDRIIFAFTSSWFMFEIANLIASADPWTSDFIIIFNSSEVFCENALSFEAKLKLLIPSFVLSQNCKDD